MKTGIELITQERQDQIEKHGRTVESDSIHNYDLQLSRAAARLCHDDIGGYWSLEKLPKNWSQEIWDKMTNKPYIKRLIIAGALIAAEIDRLNYNVEQEDKANENR